MSRKELISNILTMFVDFPPEIQEAIVTGWTLGEMQAKHKARSEPAADADE